MSIIINNIKYIIIKELGKGGFGKVNQVLSELDNKYYAIKEIPIKEASQEQIKNSQNEIYILKILKMKYIFYLNLIAII